MSSACCLPFSISMRKDSDFGSKRRKKRFALETQEIERGQIGFPSTTMAHIYSPGDAMVDLLGVMQSELVMEIDHHSEDRGDSSRRVRKRDG